MGILSTCMRRPRAVDVVGAPSGGVGRRRPLAAHHPIVGAGTAASAAGRQRGWASVQLRWPWPAPWESLERKEGRRPLSRQSDGRGPRRAEWDGLTSKAQGAIARCGHGRITADSLGALVRCHMRGLSRASLDRRPLHGRNHVLMIPRGAWRDGRRLSFLAYSGVWTFRGATYAEYSSHGGCAGGPVPFRLLPRGGGAGVGRAPGSQGSAAARHGTRPPRVANGRRRLPRRWHTSASTGRATAGAARTSSGPPSTCMLCFLNACVHDCARSFVTQLEGQRRCRAIVRFPILRPPHFRVLSRVRTVRTGGLLIHWLRGPHANSRRELPLGNRKT